MDEPPAFQNGPKPYQAVVAYEQPVGMHVYKVNSGRKKTISEFSFLFSECNRLNEKCEHFQIRKKSFY